jgi:hypothetical protein
MKHWWLLLVGLFAGLWLSERQRRIDAPRTEPSFSVNTAASTRPSRTLDQITPLYAEMAKHFAGDDALYEDHHKAWVAYVRGAVQPDLTEREALEVAQSILEFQPPAYNYQEPLFPSWEKEEGNEPPSASDA